MSIVFETVMDYIVPRVQEYQRLWYKRIEERVAAGEDYNRALIMTQLEAQMGKTYPIKTRGLDNHV